MISRQFWQLLCIEHRILISKNSTWVDFTKILQAAFMSADPKSVIKNDGLIVFFLLVWDLSENWFELKQNHYKQIQLVQIRGSLCIPTEDDIPVDEIAVRNFPRKRMWRFGATAMRIQPTKHGMESQIKVFRRPIRFDIRPPSVNFFNIYGQLLCQFISPKKLQTKTLST